MSSHSPFLPACPLCSTISTIERPYWRFARHQSAASGVDHFLINGCNHVREVIPPKAYADGDEIQFVEGLWAHAAGEIFEIVVRTRKLSPKAADDFRRHLDGRNTIAGLAQQLGLGEGF